MTFRETGRENIVQYSDSGKLYPISYVEIMLVDLSKDHKDKGGVWFGLNFVCLFLAQSCTATVT